MKKLITISILSLIASGIGAQEVELKTFSHKGKNVEYTRFQDTSQPKAVLLVISQSDTSQTLLELSQQLYPLAEKNGWLMLGLKSSEGKDYWEAISKIHILEADSLSDQIPVFLFTSGSGYATRFKEFTDTNLVSGILVLRPVKSSSLHDELDNKPFVAMDNLPLDSVLNDTLLVQGVWLNSVGLKSESPVDYMSLLPVMDKGFVYLDSLHQILSDSVQLEKLNQRIGVINQLPEIVRGGRPIKLKVFVPKPAECQFYLNDLSGESVWKVEVFLGRGEAEYVIPTKNLNWGVYQLEIEIGRYINRHKIILRG